MFDAVKQLFSDSRQTVVYECRACGTNVDADTEVCPLCESEDIVRFEC